MSVSRRQVIKAIAGSTSIASLAPRFILGQSVRKNDTLRVAAIGYGGRGKDDLAEMQSHKNFILTASCDVDKAFFGIANEFNSNCRNFQDYRQLFKQAADEFDAVVVATPDHMHAPIALMAMEYDKHIYLQKPLAQDIAECRKLAKAAADKPHLKTQMGIQIHAHGFYRTAVSWIQQGLIGTVNDVHSWSGKGWGGEMEPRKPSAIPETLNWDLYCGVSEKREYVEGWYHRNNWRKWMAFGTGTQGDMGCHIVDPVFSALGLKVPTEVTSFGPQPFKENFALISKVAYKFLGTKYTTPSVSLTWYNGSLRPTELAGLPKQIELPYQGSVFVGEKGSLILPHIGEPQVYRPDGSRIEQDKLPAKVGNANHFHEWVDAAVGETESTGAPFEYSGPLTEAVLLGTIINRWPKLRFAWDASRCKFSGETREVLAANELLAPAYRTGWDQYSR